MRSHQEILHIPRELLVSLMGEAGRTESPEEFLGDASVQREIKTGASFVKRARAAFWSRFWLLFSAIIAGGSLAINRTLEDVITVLIFSGMTVVEFRVHQWFLAGDSRAPTWGSWNQCLFALTFLVWGTYHFFTFAVPAETAEAIAMAGMANYEMYVVGIYKAFYAAVGIAGATGQFILALYYLKTVSPHPTIPKLN